MKYSEKIQNFYESCLNQSPFLLRRARSLDLYIHFKHSRCFYEYFMRGMDVTFI